MESAGRTTKKTKEDRRRQRRDDARRASEWAKRRAEKKAARSEAAAVNTGISERNLETKRSRRVELIEAERRAEEWASKRRDARLKRGGGLSDCDSQERAEKDEIPDSYAWRVIDEESKIMEAYEDLLHASHRTVEYETEMRKEVENNSRPSLFCRIVVSAFVSAAICFVFPTVIWDDEALSSRSNSTLPSIAAYTPASPPQKSVDASLVGGINKGDGDL